MLLEGDGDLVARVSVGRQLEIPDGRLSAVVDWLIERFRARSDALFGRPEVIASA